MKEKKIYKNNSALLAKTDLFARAITYATIIVQCSVYSLTGGYIYQNHLQ